MIKVYLMSHLNDYMNYYQSLNGLTKPIISKYTNEKSKMESISTEVLLNYAFYDVYNHQFSFPIQTTNTGKPVLLNETGIHFNKSHSMNYGLVVLSNVDVGCDIEYINQQFKLIPNVLTISELKMYEDAKVHQSELFFKFWTAKEAYLKLLGIGITKKFQTFSMNL